MSVDVAYIARFTNLVSPGLKKMSKDGKKSFAQMDRARDSFQKGIGGLSRKLTNAFGGALAIGGVVAFGKAVVDTTAKFQRFEAVLTNTLGSNSAAQTALSQITDFAARTPFQVDELTDSFVKLANRGFTPTVDEMTKLGDLASSLGKPFDQLTEAVLDAQTGEFERLKEFGIRARKEGDRITFNFKDQETQVANTDQAIRDYILGLGELEGVAGSMEAISKTTGGLISNLGDVGQQILRNFGELAKPAINGTLQALINLGQWVDRSVQFMRENIFAIQNVFAPLMEFFEPVRMEIMKIANALGLTGDQGTFLQSVFNAIGNVLKFLSPVFQTLGKVLASVLKFIREVVSSLVDFWKNSETLRRVVAGMANVVISTFKQIGIAAMKIFGGVGDLIKGIFSRDTDLIGGGLKKLGSVLATPFKIARANARQFAVGYAEGFPSQNFFGNDTPRRALGSGGAIPINPDEGDKDKNDTTLGPSPSASSGLGIGGVTADARAARNVTVNIGKLVETLSVQTQKLEQSPARIKELVIEALVSATRDATIIAG